MNAVRTAFTESDMNTQFLSTGQAAQRAKVSRPTISRALKSGDLQAVRDNGGQWMITPDAVDAWASHRSPVQPEQRAHSVQNGHEQAVEQLRADLAQSRETVARLEGEAAATQSRLADLAADRDRWREMAERLSQPEIIQTSRGGFWVRLLGRSR